MVVAIHGDCYSGYPAAEQNTELIHGDIGYNRLAHLVSRRSYGVILSPKENGVCGTLRPTVPRYCASMKWTNLTINKPHFSTLKRAGHSSPTLTGRIHIGSRPTSWVAMRSMPPQASFTL